MSSVWDSQHFQYVAVIGEHVMLLHGISPVSDKLCLEMIVV